MKVADVGYSAAVDVLCGSASGDETIHILLAINTISFKFFNLNQRLFLNINLWKWW